MSGTYDLTQIIYSFNQSANAVGGLSFPDLSTMQDYVTTIAQAILTDATIQGLIGSDWIAIWGPVVYAVDTSGATVHADNTMGCYYSPSNNQFVIAIAGTNPNSPFDWLDEDFAVGTTVTWESVAGTAAGSDSGNISTATATGLQILLAMTDGNGDTLLQAVSNYISAHGVSGAQVAVTGHSLAGALSPCLALYMLNNQSSWDPTGTMTISTYPTAGPTPGDSDFAEYYDGLISAGSITHVAVYNTLDVVPHAWNQDDLAQIPGIYDANITPVSGANPTDTFMGIIASGLQLNALAAKNFIGAPYNPYTAVSGGRSGMTGTFDTDVDSTISRKLALVSAVLPGDLKNYADVLENVARFAYQAVAQHTTAYPPLLNIVDFETEYQSILQANAPGSAATVDGAEVAVKKLAGIDLSRLDTEAIAKAAAKQ